MSEVVVGLTVNLARMRMDKKRSEFKQLLKQDRHIDKKETETLLAGYNRAIKDLEEVFMTLAEM